jgi:hypothetical protein
VVEGQGVVLALACQRFQCYHTGGGKGTRGRGPADVGALVDPVGVGGLDQSL